MSLIFNKQKMAIEIKVIGHKSPDTDSVCSAIVMADYLNKKGYNATAYKLGELNNETSYLLEILDIEIPETATSFPEGTKLALVDHNEKKQTIDGIENLEVEWLVDHHKIDFSTSNPLNIRMEKLCSTASVLYKMYKEAGFEINERIGKLILSAILSDSLMFKSATTTKEDITMAEELKEITGIKDLEWFAMKMFDAKSDLGHISVENLIKYDYKEFDLNGTKCGIGTLETTNPSYALGRKEEIVKGLKSIKEKDGLDFILLSVVDIINEQNTSIVLEGLESETIKNVFDAETKDNLVDLKRRLSRKKQVVPDLTDYFNKI